MASKQSAAVANLRTDAVLELPPSPTWFASDGAYRAYGIVVLTVTTTGIARLVVFADPSLVATFGLRPVG